MKRGQIRKESRASLNNSLSNSALIFLSSKIVHCRQHGRTGVQHGRGGFEHRDFRGIYSVEREARPALLLLLHQARYLRPNWVNLTWIFYDIKNNFQNEHWVKIQGNLHSKAWGNTNSARWDTSLNLQTCNFYWDWQSLNVVLRLTRWIQHSSALYLDVCRVVRTPILRSPMADLTDISEPYPVHEAYPGPPPPPSQPLPERYWAPSPRCVLSSYTPLERFSGDKVIIISLYICILGNKHYKLSTISNVLREFSFLRFKLPKTAKLPP